MVLQPGQLVTLPGDRLAWVVADGRTPPRLVVLASRAASFGAERPDFWSTPLQTGDAFTVDGFDGHWQLTGYPERLTPYSPPWSPR